MFDDMDTRASALDEIKKMLRDGQVKRLSLQASAAAPSDDDGDDDSKDPMGDAVGDDGKTDLQAEGGASTPVGAHPDEDHSPENDGTGKPELDAANDPRLAAALKLLDQLMRPSKG